MVVCQLVKTETNADSVSLVRFFGLGMYEVLASHRDAYGRTIIRRYRAVVQDDKLTALRGL